MIPTLTEISDGMTGAWRLATGDPDALDSFDMSVDGFSKSFTAIVLAAPFWLWMTLTNRNIAAQIIEADGEMIGMPPFGLFMTVETVSYLSTWLLFLGLMIIIVRILDIEERFVPFAIVYNWAMLLLYFLIAIPPVALFNIGIIDVSGKFLLDRLLYIVQLIYLWHIVRTTLKASSLQAGMIVALDFLLALLVSQISITFLYL